MGALTAAMVCLHHVNIWWAFVQQLRRFVWLRSQGGAIARLGGLLARLRRAFSSFMWTERRWVPCEATQLAVAASNRNEVGRAPVLSD